MALVTEKSPRYKVVAVLAIIPDETQGQIYLQRDMPLPSGTPDAIVQHLLDSGVIAPE